MAWSVLFVLFLFINQFDFLSCQDVYGLFCTFYCNACDIQFICMCLDSDIKVVIVHDGVRPFVCSGILPELVKTAAVVGAAGFVRPLVSTVLSTNQETVLETALIRSEHVASETPQAFQVALLLSAYNKVIFLISVMINVVCFVIHMCMCFL